MTTNGMMLNLYGPMPRKPTSAGPPLVVRYPDFGRQLRTDMKRLGLTIKDLKVATGSTYEAARLWTEGKSMPRSTSRERLAKLLGKTVSQLMFPEEGPPPGVTLIPLTDVTPDEQRLIDMYRRMPEPARKVLRVRAAELLEAFGKPSKANPYGRGRTQ